MSPVEISTEMFGRCIDFGDVRIAQAVYYLTVRCTDCVIVLLEALVPSIRGTRQILSTSSKCTRRYPVVNGLSLPENGSPHSCIQILGSLATGTSMYSTVVAGSTFTKVPLVLYFRQYMRTEVYKYTGTSSLIETQGWGGGWGIRLLSPQVFKRFSKNLIEKDFKGFKTIDPMSFQEYRKCMLFQ